MAGHNPRREIRPFPLSRRLVIDGCEMGRKKHIIHALVEIDVTRARRLIQDHKVKTGEGLSFTGFIAVCVGRVVAEDRNWHAYRKGRKLVLFDEVDIGTLIERDVEDAKLATYRVIRAVEKKTIREVHEEIRAAQKESIEATPGINKWKLFLRLPGFLRRLFWWWLDRTPELRKRLGGTVALTAIGMSGKGSGWGLPIANHTLTITLGGIDQKPGVIDGRIESREYLHATISFDHDIVDGVPAARFVTRFRELVENAYGLSVG